MTTEILEVFFENTLQNIKLEELIEFHVHIAKNILDPNVINLIIIILTLLTVV